MIRKLFAGVVAAASIFAGSSASAATIVPVLDSIVYGDNSNGIKWLRSELGYFDNPHEDAYMLFTWDRGELSDLTVYQQFFVTRGIVDPSEASGVRYERTTYVAPLCTFKSGCIELVGQREALLRVTFPEWDLPCEGPAGFECSQQMNQSYVYTEFFVHSPSHAIVRGTVTLYQNSPIPEPAAWAMMITGFGLAGAALRSRKSARA